MRLTDEEQAMLAGEFGKGVRKAMEIVIALGRIYHAEALVPVASAQVSGVSYKNLGDAGLEFLEEWAAQGARVRVPATLNPSGMDLSAWRELGFSPEFARRQERVIAAYAALGVTPTCTCTPYLVGYAPTLGQHVAWAESSAVSYANSVLGARTNREGGPSALAAAITGRTARYGMHLDEHRCATVVLEIGVDIRSETAAGALGYLVGKRVKNRVPFLRFEKWEGNESDLKALGAAMAASGAVALYHVAGVTPEAKAQCMLAPDAERVMVDSLEPAYQALDGSAAAVDLVSLGCPHASLGELEAIASYLSGRRIATALWITTARTTHEAAERESLVARIEATGARVVADTCMVVAPVDGLGFRTMATNSAKMAFYAPAHSRMSVRFGTLQQCLDAALSGRWPAA